LFGNPSGSDRDGTAEFGERVGTHEAMVSGFVVGISLRSPDESIVSFQLERQVRLLTVIPCGRSDS
jgi:hypothetical protein